MRAREDTMLQVTFIRLLNAPGRASLIKRKAGQSRSGEGGGEQPREDAD